MSENVDISNAIRAAVAHERAAAGHEDKYEQQMKAAGANMFHAFTLAARGAPEHEGRKIDDKAILRLYKSTARREWWDASLKAARLTDASGKADRDHAKRLIQWHVDPEAAQARRAQHAIRQGVVRKTVAKQKVAASRGARVRPNSEPTTAEMRNLHASVQAERDGQLSPPPDITLTVEDLLGEVNRLSAAVRRVSADHRADALEILRVTAREIERYIA